MPPLCAHMKIWYACNRTIISITTECTQRHGKMMFAHMCTVMHDHYLEFYIHNIENHFFFLGGVIINIFPLFSPTNKWLCSLARERQDMPAFTSSLVIFARLHDTHTRGSVAAQDFPYKHDALSNSRQLYAVYITHRVCTSCSVHGQ